MESRPSPQVLDAFGATGEPLLLRGGGGRTWQVGEVVLKPAPDGDEAAWVADLFSQLEGPGFRVPRPVRARSGGWVADGWAAWRRVEGEPGPVRHWSRLVAACRAFHSSLAGVPPPPWLRWQAGPWARADRVAWGEDAAAFAPELQAQIDVLRAALRPVDLPFQLIHGDIGGNVLFVDETGQVANQAPVAVSPVPPPAVIDFAPYFRPAGFALAIAAVDGLTWSGAPPSILDQIADEPEMDQLLVRALLFRLAAESFLRRDAAALATVRAASQPVADLILARAAGAAAAT